MHSSEFERFISYWEGNRTKLNWAGTGDSDKSIEVLEQSVRHLHSPAFWFCPTNERKCADCPSHKPLRVFALCLIIVGLWTAAPRDNWNHFILAKFDQNPVYKWPYNQPIFVHNTFVHKVSFSWLRLPDFLPKMAQSELTSVFRETKPGSTN